MPNVNQPTIKVGGKGDAVKRAQRGLRRTPDLSVVVDGVFGPATEQAVKSFQESSPPLAVDGIVGTATWAALPDGGPMPVLKQGSELDVVLPLQEVLKSGAVGQWGTAPGEVDGRFGPHTRASVEAFQKRGHVKADGVIGDQTWDVSLHAMSADLETVVGLQYIVG
jgi:peptidoglycan hydrolase-like protein with peptidoglycan-binding domain